MNLIVLAIPPGEDQVDGGLEVPTHDGQGFPGEWLVRNPHLAHSKIQNTFLARSGLYRVGLKGLYKVARFFVNLFENGR